MKPFIRKTFGLFLCIILLILFDQLCGISLGYVLSHVRDGRYYKLKYSIEDCNEEIIIIGSSRSETGCNPARFRKRLGISCWNSSRAGQGIMFWSMIQQEILKRYSPGLIILNIDPDGLEGEVNPGNDHILILKPFAKTSPAILNQLSSASWTDPFKFKSNIYIYNSSLFYLLRPLFVRNKDGKPSEMGWKPKYGSAPPAEMTAIPPDSNRETATTLNSQKLKLLKQMTDLAKAKNIRLAIVFSPDLAPSARKSKTLIYAENVCRREHLLFYNFLNDTSFVNKPALFYNGTHLNDKGANLFSAQLADSLFSWYQKNNGLAGNTNGETGN